MSGAEAVACARVPCGAIVDSGDGAAPSAAASAARFLSGAMASSEITKFGGCELLRAWTAIGVSGDMLAGASTGMAAELSLSVCRWLVPVGESTGIGNPPGVKGSEVEVEFAVGGGTLVFAAMATGSGNSAGALSGMVVVNEPVGSRLVCAVVASGGGKVAGASSGMDVEIEGVVHSVLFAWITDSGSAITPPVVVVAAILAARGGHGTFAQELMLPGVASKSSGLA